MLLKYLGNCNWLLGILLISVLVWGIARYAYRANLRRPPDDPNRQDFDPQAVVLAPITWLPLLIAWPLIFIARALLYGLFLILFTIALVLVRKPFLFIWLDRIFISIGNRLLRANTALLRLAYGQ